MRSFILGIVVCLGGLVMAHQSYGTLKPCDMLAKERASDAAGGSQGLRRLAANIWQAHRVDDMNVLTCSWELAGEWVTNGRELVGLED